MVPVPTGEQETARLRDLHDDYAWELNAAIAEGREDLIAGLVDDYLAAAVQQMARDRVPGQDPPRPLSWAVPGRRRRWFPRRRCPQSRT